MNVVACEVLITIIISRRKLIEGKAFVIMDIYSGDVSFGMRGFSIWDA